MFKVSILALCLIALVSTHPGHGNALNEEQKSAWTTAFEAKRAHLAAQHKFHTSELDRYTNRDEQYAAMDEDWAKESPVHEKCVAQKIISREFVKKEREINKYVTVNQNARNPLLAKYRAALKTAYNTRQAKKLARRLATAESVTSNRDAYMNAAKKANTDEQAFHHVEFTEFAGEETCIQEAEKRMAEAETLDEDMKHYYKECTNKVKKDVKQAVVNVADNQRRVSRKDLSKLWKEFVRTCNVLSNTEGRKKKAEKQAAMEKAKADRLAAKAQAKADREAAKANKGKRILHPGHGKKGGPITQEQKDAWEKAFALKDIHQAAQRKFHNSEFLRYKARAAMLEDVDAASKKGDDGKTTLGNIRNIVTAEKKAEKVLDKTINANKAARNAPLKTYKGAMRSARRGKRFLQEEPECAADVTAAFEKWYNTSKTANDAETAFHTVEFQEFDRDDECTKAAREKLAGSEEIQQRAFAKETMGCYKKVQQEVKKPVVNKADANRKKERSPIRAEWRAYMQAGRACFKGKRGGKRGGKKGKAGRRQLFAKYQAAVRDLKAYVDQA